MSDEKKKISKIDIIWDILGLEGLFFKTGKNIAMIVGCAMIVTYMVDFYLSFMTTVSNNIFTLAFMFAVMSVPLALSYYMMDKFGIFDMFGVKDE